MRELGALKAALRLGYKTDKVKKVPHTEMPDEGDRIEEGEFSPVQIAGLLKELPPHLVPLIRFSGRASGGKFVVSMAGEVYAEQARGSNRKSRR